LAFLRTFPNNLIIFLECPNSMLWNLHLLAEFPNFNLKRSSNFIVVAHCIHFSWTIRILIHFWVETQICHHLVDIFEFLEIHLVKLHELLVIFIKMRYKILLIRSSNRFKLPGNIEYQISWLAFEKIKWVDCISGWDDCLIASLALEIYPPMLNFTLFLIHYPIFNSFVMLIICILDFKHFCILFASLLKLFRMLFIKNFLVFLFLFTFFFLFRWSGRVSELIAKLLKQLALLFLFIFFLLCLSISSTLLNLL